MILLDTHVLIWWFENSRHLPASVRQKINRHSKDNTLAVSAMSIWEIALLVKKKRLVLTMDIETWVSKVSALPFMQVIAPNQWVMMKSALLPEPFHPDPADRILVATALVHHATLVTKDAKIINYPHVPTYWKD